MNLDTPGARPERQPGDRPFPITLFCMLGFAGFPLFLMEMRAADATGQLPTAIKIMALGMATIKLVGYIGLFRMRKWGPLLYTLGLLIDLGLFLQMGKFHPRLFVGLLVAFNGWVYRPWMR